MSNLFKEKKEKLKKRTKLTWSLIVINIDSLKLKVAVTDVFALWIYSMFIGNDFPELIKNARDLLSIRHIQKKPIKKLVWTGTASWRANPTRNRGLEPATQGRHGCGWLIHVSGHYAGIEPQPSCSPKREG
jgi:hypothetical protein